MSSPLNILMVIPSLPVGGAEQAFVRLANALAEQHRVTAYVPYRCDSAPALVRGLEGVKLVSLPLPHPVLHRVLYKLSLLLQRILPFFDLEQRLHSLVLRTLHRLERFDVVNPHLRSGSLMACHAFRTTPVPVVEHDHGDYALLKKESPNLNAAQPLLQRVDAEICPSEYNARLVDTLPWRPDFQRTVVPYCMPPAKSGQERTDPTFTFGMVARGVEEKGWTEAVTAFRTVSERTTKPMRLVLVGGGPALDRLKRDVAKEEAVVFTGYQADPARWISGFDVGLLPSFFAAESLPCAIIECLSLGKPVIATSVGGIPEMLQTPQGPCGTLVPLDPETGRADVAALAEAMQTLAEDNTLLRLMTDRARNASKTYDATTCARACAEFFRFNVNRRRPTEAPRQPGAVPASQNITLEFRNS